MTLLDRLQRLLNVRLLEGSDLAGADNILNVLQAATILLEGRGRGRIVRLHARIPVCYECRERVVSLRNVNGCVFVRQLLGKLASVGQAAMEHALYLLALARVRVGAEVDAHAVGVRHYLTVLLDLRDGTRTVRLA